eukprot:TRINITY_DN45687_c0_g1_i1.p1 TRINITY_DN45687_c0_g1~~TRINITY_DN45687_c0_g1_i1.p1  ORF type:complete len:778 (-),score=147.57 TRINITY_DN45687_c0_g1_i1:41-2332(-)
MEHLNARCRELSFGCIAKFVKEADRNKDSQLDGPELGQLLFPGSAKLSDDESETVNACMSLLDKDGSGSISLTMFLRFILESLLNQEASVAELGKAMFQAIDADNDKSLTLTEFEGFLKCQTDHEREATSDFFAMLDVDKSGCVSVHEFARGFADAIIASFGKGIKLRRASLCADPRYHAQKISDVFRRHPGFSGRLSNAQAVALFTYLEVPKIEFEFLMSHFKKQCTAEEDSIDCEEFLEYLFQIVDVPSRYTAYCSSFPEFESGEVERICFNLREDEAEATSSCPFCWQGAYCRLDSEGVPTDAAWKEHLGQIASTVGAEKVQAYCKSQLRPGDQVFWSPAKARRWGAFFPAVVLEKATTHENLLIKSADAQWRLVEVDPNDGAATEFALANEILGRITYSYFELAESASGAASSDPSLKCFYGDDTLSLPAWVDGATLLLPASCGQLVDPTSTYGRAGRRRLQSVPPSFQPHRYVPLARRKDFFAKVAAEPHITITGATLPKNSPFSSPVAGELAHAIGVELGELAESLGVRHMVSASMQGHSNVASADADFTRGFVEAPGARAVHFKGTNMVNLHARAWTVSHGMNYLLEEECDNFSNNAKEAALMVASSHAKSVALLAGGGPTVALNLCRMLLVCSSRRVFTISGMHAPSGTSGASGFFCKSSEELAASVHGLDKLVGEGSIFARFASISAEEIDAELRGKPLTLLNVDAEAGCSSGEYVLQGGSNNAAKNPGLNECSEVPAYAKACAKIMRATAGGS